MKTTLAISLLAGFSIIAFTFQAAEILAQNPLPVTRASLALPGPCATMIGAGVIREKSGNNFVIQSDDGNSYFSEFSSRYAVNEYVFHSDPEHGWVDILGRAD